VDLVQIAKDGDEDNGTSVLKIAPDALKEREVRLKARWHEDHGQVFKQKS